MSSGYGIRKFSKMKQRRIRRAGGRYAPAFGTIQRVLQQRVPRPVIFQRRAPVINFRTGGFLGTEYKYYDTVFAAATISNSWAGGECDPVVQSCLFAPTKGTGPSNRDGDKTCITSIQLRGAVTWYPGSDQADTSVPGHFCVALVLDRQTNATQLSAENVMVDTAPKEFSFRNIQYKDRFKILKVIRGTLHQTAAFPDGANTGTITGNARYINWFMKTRIPVDHVADGGTVADIGGNSLHVIACTNLGNGAVLKLQYHARVRFVG